MTMHILESYDEDLKQANSLIALMFGHAEKMLADAITAMEERDVKLAQDIIQSDKKLNHMQVTAENASIDIVARRAPVADDLRETIGILKVAQMIERIGDYAKGIAKRTIDLAETDYTATPEPVKRLGQEASLMYKKISEAYLLRDNKAALKVWENNNHLGSLYDAAYRNIMSMMMEAPDKIATFSHFLTIAKNLERIGDQSSNISETIHYVVTGQDVEEMRQQR